MTEEDNEFIPTKLQRSAILAILLLISLQVADILLTLHMVSFTGPEVEVNPLVKFFLERGWLWQLKTATFTIGGLIFWFQRDNIRINRFLWTGVGIYSVVVAWNTYQLASAGLL